MNNPLIEEIRSARAARAESLGYDPNRIGEWARIAHAKRQRELNLKNKSKAKAATATKSSD